jgi:membrane fusion protein (multidrug efflux system)
MSISGGIMNISAVTEKLKTADKRIVSAAVATIVTAVVAALYLLMSKGAHEAVVAGDEIQPLTVTTRVVRTRTIEAAVSAAGTLSSRNISVLSSKIMGRVSELTVQEGDRVSAGKLLARIDSGEITAQVYQAQAAYNNAKLHYDRIKKLFDEQAATQMEMDQATLGFESARAGLNAAKAMESYTIITAPISGQVMEKRVNLGEMAMPGQPIFKVEDNRNLRLDVTMKEQDIRYARVGDRVSVQIDALPGRVIRGRVAQVVPAADIRTHSFIVKIDIPADKSLITGMYGKALFPVGKREAILVPETAIVTMAGLTGVYMVNAEGKAIFQMIHHGDSRGGDVEVTTGVKEGDRIIISRHDGRIEGRKIVEAEQ